jgi:hypothetical protein
VRYRGIRGWLIIPTIGLIFGPLLSIFVLRLLMRHESDQTPGVIICTAQIILQVAITFAFFRKKRFVPKLMMAVYVLGIVYGVYMHEKQKAYLGDRTKLVQTRQHAAAAADARDRIDNPFLHFITPHVVPALAMQIPGTGPVVAAGFKLERDSSELPFVAALLCSAGWPPSVSQAA